MLAGDSDARLLSDSHCEYTLFKVFLLLRYCVVVLLSRDGSVCKAVVVLAGRHDRTGSGTHSRYYQWVPAGLSPGTRRAER